MINCKVSVSQEILHVVFLKKNGDYWTDSVVFDCTDEANDIVFWDIISGTTIVYSFVLGTMHHVGRASMHL